MSKDARPVVGELPILAVDDEEVILELIENTLRAAGWEARGCLGPLDALELIEQQEFSVVISDFRMPRMDGIEFLGRVRQKWPNTERILLTAHADEDALERGINDASIHRFIRKPWQHQNLIATLTNALHNNRLRREHDVLVDLLRNRNEELRYLTEQLYSDAEETERALEGIRRRWSVALNAISDPIIIIGNDMRVEGGNAAAANQAGVDAASMEGRHCYDLLFGRRESCESCPIKHGRGRLHLNGGAEDYRAFDALAYALPGESPSHLCVYHDVTSEVQFRRESARIEKMAALGRLAGSVAHEINNPLHGILSFAQLAQKPNVPPEKLDRYLQIIRENAVRCSEIIKSLRTYSRLEKLETHDTIDLNDVLSKSLVLFESVKDRNFICDPYAGRAVTIGNSNQLQQVCINLLQNAVDATPEYGKVRIAVEPEESRWCVVVEDEGPGIAETEHERILEPFYTTKPEGIGTGLGLSISHNIIREHGGSLQISRSALGGARFEVRLPRTDN